MSTSSTPITGTTASDSMPQKVTIAALRKWKIETFLQDLAYTPDNTPPESRTLASLGLHKRNNVVLKQHATKAISVGRTLGGLLPVWANPNLLDETISCFYVDEDEDRSQWYPKTVWMIEQRAPLKGDDNEIKAILYYFFLDRGGIEELTAYDGFYNHLEKAFRHHVRLKKRVTDPANTQHNTFGTTSQTKRPRDEEDGLDVQSRKYIDRITLTQKPMADH
jgi:hypothetical protein